jgi:hypothetical protein
MKPETRTVLTIVEQAGRERVVNPYREGVVTPAEMARMLDDAKVAAEMYRRGVRVGLRFGAVVGLALGHEAYRLALWAVHFIGGIL